MKKGHHYFYTIDEDQWIGLIKDTCSHCETPIQPSVARYKHRGNLCGPCNLMFHRLGLKKAKQDRLAEQEQHGIIQEI